MQANEFKRGTRIIYAQKQNKDKFQPGNWFHLHTTNHLKNEKTPMNNNDIDHIKLVVEEIHETNDENMEEHAYETMVH